MTEGLTNPLLSLFGQEDASPDLAQVARMEQDLKRHDNTYEFHTYENAKRGLFADCRPRYWQHPAGNSLQHAFTRFDKHLT